jgi:hypothetical protein
VLRNIGVHILPPCKSQSKQKYQQNKTHAENTIYAYNINSSIPSLPKSNGKNAGDGILKKSSNCESVDFPFTWLEDFIFVR